MKKKLFAIAALMLCMVMLLSSCSLFSKNIKFKKFVDDNYQPEVVERKENGRTGTHNNLSTLRAREFYVHLRAGAGCEPRMIDRKSIAKGTA